MVKLFDYIDTESKVIDEIDYGATEPNKNFQDTGISRKSVAKKKF